MLSKQRHFVRNIYTAGKGNIHIPFKWTYIPVTPATGTNTTHQILKERTLIH